MKHFLGPFGFLLAMPNLIIPARFTRTRLIARMIWQVFLLFCVLYIAAAQIYYEFYLWSFYE